MNERVTVIVVNWNRKDCLMQCLEAVRMQSYLEVVTMVVDNGSQDRSVEAVRERFPEVVLVPLSQNFGFAAANNIAIRQVDTEYVALLNNDAMPHPSWLETLMTTLSVHPEAGSAASKMLFYDDPLVIDRAGDVYTTAGAGCLRGRGMNHDAFDRREWIFGACAGAALYRAAVFREIGLFDEDFFLLYEDVDLSFRAQLRGWKCLYVPEAVVYHKASHTIAYDSPVSVYYGHRNLEWVYAKNMPISLVMRTIGSHLLYIAASFGFFASRGLAIPYLRSKRDSLRAWRAVWRKRQIIQAGRRVAVNDIWSLFEAEDFISRLIHRRMRQKTRDKS